MPRKAGATDEDHQRMMKKTVAQVLVSHFVSSLAENPIISGADTCKAVPVLMAGFHQYARKQAGEGAPAEKRNDKALELMKLPGVEYLFDVMRGCEGRQK